MQFARRMKIFDNDGTSPETESSRKNSTYNFEEISPDDEIYLLQCPELLDKNTLIDKIVYFNQTNQISDIEKNENLIIDVLPIKKEYVSIALPGDTTEGMLIRLPLSGHILIQKVMNSFSSCESDIQTISHDNVGIVFPQKLKARHPLLGVNWKKHISIAEKAIAHKNKKQKIKSKHLKTKRMRTESKSDILEKKN